MAYGFGIDPLGQQPYGTSASAPAEDTNAPTIAARSIDWLSNDFTVVNYSMEAINPNKQRVLLALLTKKGSSSAIPDFGNEVLNIEKINPLTLERQVQDYVKQALSHIEEITILAINVDKLISNSRVSYEVVYLDNSTGSIDTIEAQG